MSVNTEMNKPLGATNSSTVFPMVPASKLFGNDVEVSTKFRGYDTYSRTSTTRFVHDRASGTGNQRARP